MAGGQRPQEVAAETTRYVVNDVEISVKTVNTVHTDAVTGRKQ